MTPKAVKAQWTEANIAGWCSVRLDTLSFQHSAWLRAARGSIRQGVIHCR